MALRDVEPAQGPRLRPGGQCRGYPVGRVGRRPRRSLVLDIRLEGHGHQLVGLGGTTPCAASANSHGRVRPGTSSSARPCSFHYAMLAGLSAGTCWPARSTAIGRSSPACWTAGCRCAGRSRRSRLLGCTAGSAPSAGMLRMRRTWPRGARARCCVIGFVARSPSGPQDAGGVGEVRHLNFAGEATACAARPSKGAGWLA